jgi:hypothetical protein
MSAIAWLTICWVSATITWRSQVGFSYHASSDTASEFAMMSGLPSLLKSATATE